MQQQDDRRGFGTGLAVEQGDVAAGDGIGDGDGTMGDGGGDERHIGGLRMMSAHD